MTLYNRLATLEADAITSAAVIGQLRTAVDAPAFMGHPFTCNGRQAIPRFVAVCNTYVRVYQFVGGRYRDALGDWTSAGAALAR
jgi:branched-chain amino acid transport system substrate-binding protein